MVKVRFLQSVALVGSSKTYGFNDELEVKDENLAKRWAKKGLVDILVEEKNEPKTTPKTSKRSQKRAKNEVETDV